MDSGNIKYYKVNEISVLAGISVRTLHHYDKINLLKPSKNDNNGYRLYTYDDLKKLQQILIYKELGFELKIIKQMMESKKSDITDLLKKQKSLLEFKKVRIENIILEIENQISGSNSISFTELNNNDFTKKQQEYVNEVITKWGRTKEYKEFSAKNINDDIQNMGQIILKEISENIMLEPSNMIVQRLVKKWHEYINVNYYKCSKDMLLNLGKMYQNDKRFTEYFESIEIGLAKFMTDAIIEYSKK